jgi:transcriptional regulator with XRE-family HTH domain
MSQELSTLGRNIHIILFDKKMTRMQLAEKVGISQQMVSDIVQGNKSPKAETLIKIAKALGVTVDDLIK